MPLAKTVTWATSDDDTGKCPRGTLRQRDPVTSAEFWGQEDAEELSGETAWATEKREESEDTRRGCSRRRAATREKTMWRSEQKQKEKVNAREEEDTEKQEQEGRGDARKEEDRERRCDREKQRERSGVGREEPDTRKPAMFLEGRGCTKYNPILLKDLPLG
ncbi:hypothetical protein NDU88_004368 [Pleurodeles waltl]|uniref:Uncharacterized protein n=1 Tax=Pleurodeles waltl TaxID=8319 RepID=A0AAV7WRT1_PLEWA|nr:hypothetical protein NDU88_004368 [Pleurodeles waltl]